MNWSSQLYVRLIVCQSVSLRVGACFKVKVRPRSEVCDSGVMVRVGAALQTCI